MEITESTIYWITRLDSIKEFMRAAGLIIGVFLPVVTAGLTAMFYEKVKPVIRSLKFTPPVGCVFLLIGVGSIFVPTTKEMCAIKAIPMVINNENIKDIPTNIAELANDWIKELSPKGD